MNKLKLIYKITTSSIIKKLIEDGDELSAWQCIYGGYNDEDILRIIYVSEEDLYKLSNGIKKEYHDNGQLDSEYHVNENGEKHGLYRSWYDNGQSAQECTYKNGEYDGLCRRWYSNGQLCEECIFKEGEIDGLYRRWHDNGQLCSECTYKNGEYDGLCRSWYDNGQSAQECTYNNGIKING